MVDWRTHEHWMCHGEAVERKLQNPSSNIQCRTRAAAQSSRAQARDLAQAESITHITVRDTNSVGEILRSAQDDKSRRNQDEAILPFILATLCLIFGSRDEQ